MTVKGLAMIEAKSFRIFEDKPSKPVALCGSNSLRDLRTSSQVSNGIDSIVSSLILLLTKSLSLRKSGAWLDSGKY